MPKYSKTVRAFLAEDSTQWDVVDALVEDMPGHVSAGDLAECRQYLIAHGIDRAAMTIKTYRVVGRYMEEATTRQAGVLRSQTVSTVQEFAMRGASQEAAVDTIAKYLASQNTTRMPRSAVREMFSQDSRAIPTDPDEWTDAQWAAFDTKVVEASRTILAAFNLWQRGAFNPSVEALALLSVIQPQDLDAELQALLGANG